MADIFLKNALPVSTGQEYVACTGQFMELVNLLVAQLPTGIGSQRSDPGTAGLSSASLEDNFKYVLPAMPRCGGWNIF
jgi:hypothetical protein